MGRGGGGGRIIQYISTTSRSQALAKGLNTVCTCANIINSKINTFLCKCLCTQLDTETMQARGHVDIKHRQGGTRALLRVCIPPSV